MTSDRDKLLTGILSNLPSARDLANVTEFQLSNVISRSRITKRRHSNGIYFYEIDGASRFIRNDASVLVSIIETLICSLLFMYFFLLISREIELIIFSYGYFYKNFYNNYNVY